LIGFVDKNVAFADGFDGAEDFFEIALGAAIPFVAEVFENYNGHVRFASEATDEKGFSSTDRAAEEIAHGNEVDLLVTPEGDILAEMFLEGVLALNLVEVEARRENLDEIRTFALNELRLGAGEIGVMERFALVLAEFEEINNAVEGGTGELAAGVGQFAFDFRESRFVSGQRALQEEFNVGGSGERDINLRGLAVVAEKRVQIAAVLGENKADDIVTGEEWFAGPFADEESEGVGIGIAVGREELRVLQDDGDFETCLVGRGDGCEIGGVTQENREQLNSGA
jgi:hypothetical protein